PRRLCHLPSGLADDLRTGHRDAFGGSAELPDPTLELASMALRLLKVLLESLLVGGTVRHPYVRFKRGLELLLLAICFVQVLHQLCITGRHAGPLSEVARGRRLRHQWSKAVPPWQSIGD